MRSTLPLIVVIAISLTLPVGVATDDHDEHDHDNHDGMKNKCHHKPDKCEIGDTTIGPGETRRYVNGAWKVTGTLRVLGAGTLELDNATFDLTEASGGILANSGATVSIVASTLQPESATASYVLDLAAGSSVLLNDSTVRGGEGVKLRTSLASISGNTFDAIPQALFLDAVQVTIHHNRFVGNTVALNQTGGSNTIDSNRFEGGLVCIEDYLTNPTIVNNVFRGCHTGIHHASSHSLISGNDMADDALPPGSGIRVFNTNSPVIENNIIRNYHTGITVHNATAYVRNNTIVENGLHGVRVSANTQPMDIQGNTISSNGGDGIRLEGVHDVAVFSNAISSNGGYGVNVVGAAALAVNGNHVFANGVDGIAAVDAPGIVVNDNLVQGNAATGIVVGAGATGASLAGNTVGQNVAHGIFVRASGTTLSQGAVTGSGLSGVVVEGATSVTLAGVSSVANGLHGFRFTDAGVSVSDANASSNAGSGFEVGGASTANLVRARALDNDIGLQAGAASSVVADGAWWQGNDDAGVVNHATAVLSSECSYWGSVTGPLAAGNPTGVGDRAVGNVDYLPFATAPGARCVEAV